LGGPGPELSRAPTLFHKGVYKLKRTIGKENVLRGASGGRGVSVEKATSSLEGGENK